MSDLYDENGVYDSLSSAESIKGNVINILWDDDPLHVFNMVKRINEDVEAMEKEIERLKQEKLDFAKRAIKAEAELREYKLKETKKND